MVQPTRRPEDRCRSDERGVVPVDLAEVCYRSEAFVEDLALLPAPAPVRVAGGDAMSRWVPRLVSGFSGRAPRAAQSAPRADRNRPAVFLAWGR